MKFGSKVSEGHKSIEKSIDFEANIALQIRKSERLAWRVACCAIVAVLLMSAAFVWVMPLKEKVPYVMLADPYTGSASLTRLAPVDGIKAMAANEAINKANVSHYIIARESYDWEIIGRRDWYVVNSMSATDVAKAYTEQFTVTNPDNPDIIYGRSKSNRIKVKSLILSAKNSEGQHTLATVRFDKFIINRLDDRVDKSQSFVATLVFEYRSNINLEEVYRVENPLGFTVTSYRVDPEYSSPADAALLREKTEQALKQNNPK